MSRRRLVSMALVVVGLVVVGATNVTSSSRPAGGTAGFLYSGAITVPKGYDVTLTAYRLSCPCADPVTLEILATNKIHASDLAHKSAGLANGGSATLSYHAASAIRLVGTLGTEDPNHVTATLTLTRTKNGITQVIQVLDDFTPLFL